MVTRTFVSFIKKTMVHKLKDTTTFLLNIKHFVHVVRPPTIDGPKG